MTVIRHVVGRAEEVPPGEGRAYVVADEQIAVFRLRDGGFRAVSAICPHARGPIADGQIDSAVVICPLHQHTFDLATGRSTSGQRDLRTYPIHLDDQGHLIIEIAT